MKSFPDLTTKEKLIELLRWLGVLPAAMLGCYAGYFIGGALLTLAESFRIVNAPGDMGFNRLLRYVIWLLPMGATYVAAGAFTAPRWRAPAACTLAVMWILWTGRVHGWSHEPLIGAVVAAAGGAAYVFYTQRKPG